MKLRIARAGWDKAGRWEASIAFFLSLSLSFILFLSLSAAAVVEFRFLGFSFTIMRHSREQRGPIVVHPMVVECFFQTQ